MLEHHIIKGNYFTSMVTWFQIPQNPCQKLCKVVRTYKAGIGTGGWRQEDPCVLLASWCAWIMSSRFTERQWPIKWISEMIEDIWYQSLSCTCIWIGTHATPWRNMHNPKRIHIYCISGLNLSSSLLDFSSCLIFSSFLFNYIDLQSL